MDELRGSALIDYAKFDLEMPLALINLGGGPEAGLKNVFCCKK